MKKLPDFDNHPIAENYNLNDEGEEVDLDNQTEDSKEASGDKGKDDFAVSDKSASDENAEKNGTQSKASNNQGPGGGEGSKLKAITDENYENNKEKLYNSDAKSINYVTMPDPILSKIIVSNKNFIKDMVSNYVKHSKSDSSHKKYYDYIRGQYKKFLNDNKKTVMYLVKEFE